MSNLFRKRIHFILTNHGQICKPNLTDVLKKEQLTSEDDTLIRWKTWISELEIRRYNVRVDELERGVFIGPAEL